MSFTFIIITAFITGLKSANKPTTDEKWLISVDIGIGKKLLSGRV